MGEMLFPESPVSVVGAQYQANNTKDAPAVQILLWSLQPSESYVSLFVKFTLSPPTGPVDQGRAPDEPRCVIAV